MLPFDLKLESGPSHENTWQRHVSIPGVELDQPHTVRGFIAGPVKKNLSLDVTSETVEGRGRISINPESGS